MTPDQLGPYRVERELGAGGMGRVFAAVVEGRCPGLDVGTRVALKVVHPHLLETEGFFKRFLREAQVGQTVRHENVVRTLDCDAIGAEHFLVMEYVEGQDLRELLDELDRVPEELCRHVGREIAKGLAAIHAAGVVHRDLKPENVLITPDHVVKVMDLGVARLQDEAVRLSQTGAFVGSLHYAAPEAFRGGGADVDGRADLHALGLLLYELACGTNPYLADDVPQTLRKVLHEEPRRLGDINPQLSPFFEEVVHTLLAKDRDARFTSAGTLLSVLEDGEESTWWRERAKALRASTNRPLRRVRIPRETAVYGREKDLDRLRGLYEQAKSGDGQVVLIEGEAGIGKSRLVDELIGRLQQDGEDLNFLFGSYPPGGASTAGGGLSSAYREHFGDAGSAESLPQTPLLVPAFDAVLRGEPAPKDALELTKDSLATCFVHATRNLAEKRTTVVLIDDLHFAPEEARALFMSLALAVPGHRALLIGTMRPGLPEEWIANLSRLDHATHAELTRLGPKDLVALLRDSFQSKQLAEQLSAQIATKSDGNPFFAFEIIRGLREGQFITQTDDGTWASTRVIEDIQIPSSVLDLVNARVADLDDDERNLLDVASCWGFDFDPTLVGEALGMARIPTLQAFAKIEIRHRLVRSSGRDFVFDHHQVQEALYSSLPEMLREEYHAALADALSMRSRAAEKSTDALDGALCVDLCTHYLAGARGEDALGYLRRAMEHLSSGYLHVQCAELARTALERPALLAGRERVELLLRLCQVNGPQDAAGLSSDQVASAEEAVLLCERINDHRLLHRALCALGWAKHVRAELDDAEACLRRALSLADELNDDGLRRGPVNNLGAVALGRGDYARAREWFELLREVADRVGDARALSLAMEGLGQVQHSVGRESEAREHFTAALAHSEETGNRLWLAGTCGNIGVTYSAQARLAEARLWLERSLLLSRETGQRRVESNCVGNLGNVLRAAGDWHGAQAQSERQLALTREVGFRVGEAVALGNLTNGVHVQGHLATALQRSVEHERLCQEIHYARGELFAVLNRSLIYRDQGRLDDAMQCVHHALERGRVLGADGLLPAALLASGSVYSELGDFRTGRSELEAAVARSVEVSDHLIRCEALVLLGALELDAGATERGVKHLTESLECATKSGFELEALGARCLLATVFAEEAPQAAAAFRRSDLRVPLTLRPWLQLLLWKGTAELEHLRDAKHSLDTLLDLNPPEYHESMCQNVRVNREILAACKEQGL